MAEIKELTSDEVAAMTTSQLLTALRAEKLQFSTLGRVMVVSGGIANTLIHEFITRRESGKVTRGEFNNFFASQRAIHKGPAILTAPEPALDGPTTTYFWPGGPGSSYAVWYHTPAASRPRSSSRTDDAGNDFGGTTPLVPLG